MDKDLYQNIFNKKVTFISDQIVESMGECAAILSLVREENKDRATKDIGYIIDAISEVYLKIDDSDLQQSMDESEKNEILEYNKQQIEEIKKNMKETVSKYVQRKLNGEKISDKEFLAEMATKIGYEGKSIDNIVDKEYGNKDETILNHMEQGLINRFKNLSISIQAGQEWLVDSEVDDIEVFQESIKNMIRNYARAEDRDKMLEDVDNKINGKLEKIKQMTEKYLNDKSNDSDAIFKEFMNLYDFNKENNPDKKEGIPIESEVKIKQHLGELIQTQADLFKAELAHQKVKFNESINQAINELEEGSAVSKQISQSNIEYKNYILVAKEELDKQLIDLKIGRYKEKGNINKSKANIAILKGELAEISKNPIVKHIKTMEKYKAQIDAKLKNAKEEDKDSLLSQKKSIENVLDSAYNTPVGSRYKETKHKISLHEQKVKGSQQNVRDSYKKEKELKANADKLINKIKNIAKMEKEYLLPTKRNKLMAFLGNIKAKMGIGKVKYERNVLSAIKEAKEEINSNILQPAKEGISKFGNDTKQAIQNKAIEAREGIANIGNKAKEGAINIGNKAKEGAINIGNKAKEGAINIGNKAKEGIDTIGNKAKSGYIAARSFMAVQSNEILKKLDAHIERRINENNQKLQTLREKTDPNPEASR